MEPLTRAFLELARRQQALMFGSFRTKAGRISPYFFNSAAFYQGAAFAELARLYAHKIIESRVAFDLLFGAAYKGIPLVAAVAMALAEKGISVPFFFDRKEAKTHGEGGILVGQLQKGQRVLILDDVLSAGTSVRASIELLTSQGAEVSAVVVALDREERGSQKQAAAEIEETFGVRVVALARLSDLIAWLATDAELIEHAEAIAAYRACYGVVSEMPSASRK